MNEIPALITTESDSIAKRRREKSRVVVISAGVLLFGALLIAYLLISGREPDKHEPTLLEEANHQLTWPDTREKPYHLFRSAGRFRAANDLVNEQRMLDATAKTAATLERPDDRAKWFTNVAEEYTRLGRTAEAKALLKAAEPAAWAIENTSDKAESLTALAAALLHVGDSATGEPALREAERLAGKLSQASVTLPLWASISLVCTEYGNDAQAEVHVQEALRILTVHFNAEERAWGGAEAAAMFYRAGRPEVGRKLFDLAYSSAKKIEYPGADRASALSRIVSQLEPFRDQLPLQEVKDEARRAAQQINDNPGMRDGMLRRIDDLLN